MRRAGRPALRSSRFPALGRASAGVKTLKEGHGAEAVPYFKRAQELKPTNWNFKRQAWNLGDMAQDYGTPEDRSTT